MKKVWIEPKSKDNLPCYPGQPKRKLTGPAQVDIMAHGAWWARRLKKNDVVRCEPVQKKKETKKKETKKIEAGDKR